MNRMHRMLGAILAALLLLSLCACGAVRGRTDQYSGYTVRTEKARTSEQTAETEAPARALNSEAEDDYILNRGSKKFHYPDCSGVQDIKEHNRWNYHGTRQSILDMGYTPCKICNP